MSRRHHLKKEKKNLCIQQGQFLLYQIYWNCVKELISWVVFRGFFTEFYFRVPGHAQGYKNIITGQIEIKCLFGYTCKMANVVLELICGT